MPQEMPEKNTQKDLEKAVQELNRDSRKGQTSFLRSAGAFLFELLKVLVISLVIILPIRYYVIQPFYVVGASMEPNLHDYQYIVIDEISYRFRDVDRGEIVVLKNVDNQRQYLIKRVIGLPGEQVEITPAGDVVVTNTAFPDGNILSEKYLGPTIETNGANSWQLKDNEYFVMGDNRSASLDSRIFGPVTQENIVGRAWIRAWPLKQLTHFTPPNY